MMNRTYVDSLYCSGDGSRVKIRTHYGRWQNMYIIFVDGRVCVETLRKSSVRAFIVDLNCQPVDSF